MNTIANAIQRLETTLRRRRDFGVGTARSVTTLRTGLHCVTAEKEWRTESDLAPALGGNASAPPPGVLLRAAVGSCLAMCYRLRAAKHEVALTSLRVTVAADSEVAGMLFTDAPAPPGFTEWRVHVEVASPARSEDVMRVIDEGDRLGPLFDVLSRAQTIRRTVSIAPAGS